MTVSRITAVRRGRYEATEAIRAWTAAYDESGQMFWYDELTHETTYDPCAGRRHPQLHHQAMSHNTFFARGSTSSGGHIPQQTLLQDGGDDYPMPPASAYPYAAPVEASEYLTSSGHMVSPRAPSYAEIPSRFSPLHQQQYNHHQQHHQQHYQQQHHHHHHHHHHHGRQGYGAIASTALVNGYRWEECFKMDGKKFWRHKETGVIIHKDPYR